VIKEGCLRRKQAIDLAPKKNDRAAIFQGKFQPDFGFFYQ
jgi:hypothetical protein